MSETGFSQAEERTLCALLDVIIPPSQDGVMPGAGEIGLAGEIARNLEASPGMQAPVAVALGALDRAAVALGGDDFSSLSPVDRTPVVDEISSEHPILVPLLVYHTYLRYYRQVRVLEGLGLEGRAPHPEGYELEVGDLGLLDPVRQKKPMFRTLA